MLRKLIDLGLFIFMGLSIPVIGIYLFALYDKLSRPTYKNLSGDDYFWTGLVLGGVVIIDFLFLKRMFRSKQ